MANLSNKTDKSKTYLFLSTYILQSNTFIYIYFTTGILKGPVALDSTMVEEDSDSPIIALTDVFPGQVCSAVNS